MKHATSTALDRITPLLEVLRELPGLKEKSRGVFYRKSSAFLHFHEDPAGLFADLRQTDGEFVRYRIETLDEQNAFATLAKGTMTPGCGSV